MLSLQDRGLRQRMDIVVEADLIVIFFSCLAGQALVVRENQIIGLAGIVGVIGLDEIVLHVALGAHQRAHLLMTLLLHIETSAGKCLIERRTGRTQVHRRGIVTVGATNGVHLFGTQLTPLLCIEVRGIHHRLLVAQFTHHTRYIGALTSPTGRRLHITVAIDTGITRAQDLTHILQGMLMTARRIIMAREGIASP